MGCKLQLVMRDEWTRRQLLEREKLDESHPQQDNTIKILYNKILCRQMKTYGQDGRINDEIKKEQVVGQKYEART